MSEIRHTPVARTMVQVLPPGGGIDAHRHDENQIVYAGRGVLSVTTDSGSWIAPETKALWVPAGTVHEHRAYGETELRTIGLPARDNPLGLDTPAVLAVGPLLRELIRAYTEGGSANQPHDPARDTPERRRLRLVLIDQLRHAPQQPVRLPTARDPRLVAVCALLAENLTDNRTLAALGAQVGAAERTLSRLFRAELGMTFPQWRTQLRLHRALILLAGNTPVTAVAQRCGWSTASAFIDVFRATFGHTPGTLLRTVT
jgi:AraC-like DNA-binding protein